MAIYNVPGAILEQDASSTTAPLVVLFERDDAIAVPLLSQLRLAGYDVRASRTPVELFDILSKHLVSLVLVDIGAATASRREFWVALDAHRRGRAMQVMTFRYIQAGSVYDLDFEQTPRALADIEVQGALDFQRLIDQVRQRIPLQGGSPGALSGVYGAPHPAPSQGGIQPIGAMLGAASPFGSGPFSTPQHMPQPGAHPLGMAAPPQPGYAQPSYAQSPAQPAMVPGTPPSGQPFAAPSSFGQPVAPSMPLPREPVSPFEHPVERNPFSHDYEQSLFAKPLSSNPFGADVPLGGMRDHAPAAPASPSQQWNTPATWTPPSPWSTSDPALHAAPGRFGAPEGDFAPMGGGTPGPQRWDQPVQAAQFATEFSQQWNPAPAHSSVPQSEPHTPAPTFEPFNDVWTPPDAAFESADTGIMPALAPSTPHPAAEPHAAHDESPHQPAGLTANDVEFLRATQPVPVSTTEKTSRLPVVTSQSPAERALGNVLVEGALLTSQRLEVLQGIQQMLSGVDMHFKIGELALLFKFLSPDQLLAALLVSRGLVSPQQIAGLGRVKQELAASGMDYDLEGLLEMFHILPREQLRALRSELA